MPDNCWKCFRGNPFVLRVRMGFADLKCRKCGYLYEGIVSEGKVVLRIRPEGYGLEARKQA